MTQTSADQDTRQDAEFQHEKQHLADVVSGIDKDVQSQEELVSKPLMGPHVKAADAALAHAKETLGKLESARNNPFFGRLDYSQEGSDDVRTVYIGRHLVNIKDVPNGLVINHNAPLATLYYNPGAGKYVIPADGKRVRKDVTREATAYLNRTLAIEEAQLLDFEDALRLETPRMLTQRLSGPSSEQLQDAVETLQPEQYAALSKTDSPVLIVQGAAGTGKSVVALQRIAFMLSPASTFGILGRNPNPERVIMFGPSQAFLKYVSGLLPALDVNNVRQTTTTDWILSQFSARVTLRGRSDKVFDDLMNNHRKSGFQGEIKAHQFKGSLKMKRLLDNYVHDITKKSIRATKRQANSVTARLSLDITVVDFRSRVDNAFALSPEPNAARLSFIDGLARVRSQTVSLGPRRRNSPMSDILETHRTEISRELQRYWPVHDFRSEYVRLLSGDDVLMTHANKGDLDEDLAIEVCTTMPRNARGQSLGQTDLAAALYLDYKLNGFSSENFEHVVVDEAQDVSPLEIEILRMNSANESFTILGDLKQGLLPHRSIENWNEFGRLFDRANVERFEMRRTYRNTKQITQYANRILKGIPMRTTGVPQAYGRSGARPELARAKSAAEMQTNIADAIERLHEQDNVGSIGILTKWESTAKDIVKTLKSEGIDGVSRLEQGGKLEKDIIVSPIILTKGLEFDAVIVANAGKNNFNETEFDRMLLYLACTRARHYLEIHWHGTRSPIVPDTDRLAR
ncbi:MAG: UvrD-helicase domain-containing protein [Chloroflexi bacterium]|nr:UvrD-helicase domain-containing protein [Chloroflexota bacterium]